MQGRNRAAMVQERRDEPFRPRPRDGRLALRGAVKKSCHNFFNRTDARFIGASDLADSDRRVPTLWRVTMPL